MTLDDLEKFLKDCVLNKKNNNAEKDDSKFEDDLL